MTGEVKRRGYRSAVRTEQARRTRGRMTEAARELFIQRGYSGTSITAIAASAEVAPETVYGAFGSKRGVLEEVVARGIEADPGEPDDFLERSWMRGILSLPGLEARLLEWTRHTAATVGRMSPVHAVIRAAAASDPEIARLYSELQEYRFGSQRRILEAIAGRAPRIDVAAAAETFSALTSPELHHLLTVVRGWSEARYVRWLEATAPRAVLSAPSERG